LFLGYKKGPNMTTRKWLRAALPALVMLGGCAGSEYFTLAYWQRDSSGQTTGVGVSRTGGATTVTLAGNPDVVAQRFRNVLAQLGMQAQITSDAEGIRISSTTREGKQLTVTLKHGTGSGGEFTSVNMEWSGGADVQIEADLLRMVAGAR
jgi:hypothetical protein